MTRNQLDGGLGFPSVRAGTNVCASPNALGATTSAHFANAEPSGRSLHEAVRVAVRPSLVGIIAAGLAATAPCASAAAFPAVFDLERLLPAAGGDGSEGFVLFGGENDRSGRSVSGAGDLNGDGLDDVVIGGDGYGAVYVVFGSTAAFDAIFPLQTLYPARGGDGSRGFVLAGTAGSGARDFVDSDGDTNGDGLDDLIVGDALGASYVVFGRHRFPPVFSVQRLYPDGGGDGSRGFVLDGIDNSPPDLAGWTVAGGGDVNGDGLADVIVGAPLADAAGHVDAGESYVVFGSSGGMPAVFPLGNLYPAGGGDGSRGFVLPGIDAEDSSGYAMGIVGDLNGDGADDLVIGAPFADPDGKSRAGESYLVFGSANGFPPVVPLRSLYPAGGGDGSRGVVLSGIVPTNQSGFSVNRAGDVNGDGLDDLVIGAPNAEGGSGQCYVLFGSAQSFPAVVRLGSLRPPVGDGSLGFVLEGALRDIAGWSVGSAGDVNGDGVDDLIVGATGAAGDYVVFGRTDGFPPVIDLENLYPPVGDGTQGFVLRGSQQHTGESVSAAGDVNGDGVDDLIIGNSYYDRVVPENTGVSYVVFGRSSAH